MEKDFDLKQYVDELIENQKKQINEITKQMDEKWIQNKKDFEIELLTKFFNENKEKDNKEKESTEIQEDVLDINF